MSSTVGVRGLSVNFTKKGTYLNTGIPGTGLYDRQRIGGGSQPEIAPDFTASVTTYSDSSVGEIKSNNVDQLTSSSLSDLKQVVLEAYNDREQLRSEISSVKTGIFFFQLVRVISWLLIFGFFISGIKTKIDEKKEYLADLEQQLQNCVVNVDIHFNDELKPIYNEVVSKFQDMARSEVVWDITSSVYNDRAATRSAASAMVARTPVRFNFSDIDVIKSTYSALRLGNKNGGDLYIYPAFVIIRSSQKEFALIDIKDFQFNFTAQQFLEESSIPRDTKIVGKTWAKVNKNGQPDKRFKENYEIKIVRYGSMDLKSSSGLNESYMISNFEKSEDFSSAFSKYRSLFNP